jgi:NAD(P)-dependent dehydrogenase (short-subunit alcohol dehydrogenase family)
MKRILITGAANGLGLAMARKYASEGWSVCIADIQDEAGGQVASELKEQHGGDCFFHHLDITSEHQWQELVTVISERWLGLDALVNNAGVASSGDIDSFSPEDFQWTVDINLMGAVKGCHYCVPLLKESTGMLINVASLAGLLHMGGMSAYNASKAGMVALSEGLLSELEPYGVKVSVVCPVFFQSNLLNNMRSSNPDARAMAGKLHASSSVTAEGVATAVYEQSKKGQHYIFGIRSQDRIILWLKRFFPSAYLGLMKTNARMQFDSKNPSPDRGGVFMRFLRSARERFFGLS